jgi:transposase
MPATPAAVREWVERFPGEEVQVAVEACTGWLFVWAALVETGAVPHLAEPAETSALRGPKRRPETDRADARLLRTLLVEGRLPEAWIPPEHLRRWRTRTRLRKPLVDDRTAWLQRIQAKLFHHGVSGTRTSCSSSAAGSSSTGSACPPTPASGSRSRRR